MASQYTLPVQFSDLDAFGHVGHPDIIAYCQEPRLDMFRRMAEHTGRDLGAEAGFVVVQLEAEYKRPILRSDKEVMIHDEIVRVGNSSLGIHHRLEAAGQTAAIVRVTLVVVAEDGAPRPLNPAEREWLEERLVRTETPA